jgi:hypothetical protein
MEKVILMRNGCKKWEYYDSCIETGHGNLVAMTFVIQVK